MPLTTPISRESDHFLRGMNLDWAFTFISVSQCLSSWLNHFLKPELFPLLPKGALSCIM